MKARVAGDEGQKGGISTGIIVSWRYILAGPRSLYVTRPRENANGEGILPEGCSKGEDLICGTAQHETWRSALEDTCIWDRQVAFAKV